MAFYSSKFNAVVFLLMAIISVAVGIYLLNSGLAWWWPTLVIVVGGGAGAFFTKTLLDKRPQLVLNEVGISDKTLKVGTIRWTDLDGFRLVYVHNSVFITLEMSELSYQKYLIQFSPMKRKVLASNLSLGLTLLNLNLSKLKAKPDEVFAAIHRYHQQYHPDALIDH